MKSFDYKTNRTWKGTEYDKKIKKPCSTVILGHNPARHLDRCSALKWNQTY